MTTEPVPPVLAPPLLVASWSEHARWLVQLRWAAVVGVLATVAVTHALDVITSVIPLLIVTGMLATANLVVSRVIEDRTTDPLPSARVPRTVTWQIAIDLVALTLLLHYADAARNPFSGFYVFHIALAGLVLPWRTGARLVVLAVLLRASVVVGEALGLLEHYPLQLPGHGGDSLWQDATFISGQLLGLAGLLTATLYFTATTAARLRAAEARRAEQERLAQSRERLARVGTLAAGVAHGVRTPLHGILSGVGMLEEKLEDDAEAREVLGMINERIGAIDSLTRTLLNLGRDAPVQKEHTDLAVVLGKAARFVSTRAKDRNVKLELELAEGLEAEIDADRIAESVANLLDNAVDASPDGGCVTLRLGVPPGRADIARIEVEDRGTGIVPDQLERVFDPFFTTKPVGRGSGLGLAIARQAADEHGGHIEIASRPGEGTVVRLDVPRSEAKA